MLHGGMKLKARHSITVLEINLVSWHAWCCVTWDQEGKSFLTFLSRCCKNRPKLEGTLLMTDRTCSLLKIVHGHIILSKASPIVWVSMDENSQDWSAHFLDENYHHHPRTWLASIEESRCYTTESLCSWYTTWQSSFSDLTAGMCCVPCHHLATQKMWKPACLPPTTQLSPRHLFLWLLALYSENVNNFINRNKNIKMNFNLLYK